MKMTFARSLLWFSTQLNSLPAKQSVQVITAKFTEQLTLALVLQTYLHIEDKSASSSL